MMLDDDKCDMIFRSESFKLGNVNELTIVHLAARHGLSIQVLTAIKLRIFGFMYTLCGKYLEG